MSRSYTRKASVPETERKLDSDDPRVDVTYVVRDEPDGAICGGAASGRARALLCLVLAVGRLVPNRGYSDTEAGSERARIGISLKDRTHRIEGFRYRRVFVDEEAHLECVVGVTL